MKETSIKIWIESEGDGDWHLEQNDYLYKTTQGTDFLKKRGRFFAVIYDITGNSRDFYDFVVNRNLEMLRKIELEWNVSEYLKRIKQCRYVPMNDQWHKTFILSSQATLSAWFWCNVRNPDK